MAELVEVKATLWKYLEDARQEEDASQHSTQQPGFTVLVAEVAGLKATLSSASESCEKEQSKLEPSQLPNFTAVEADVAKTKDTMAKQHT